MRVADYAMPTANNFAMFSKEANVYGGAQIPERYIKLHPDSWA
jgi:hypothetical protein